MPCRHSGLQLADSFKKQPQLPVILATGDASFPRTHVRSGNAQAGEALQAIQIAMAIHFRRWGRAAPAPPLDPDALTKAVCRSRSAGSDTGIADPVILRHGKLEPCPRRYVDSSARGMVPAAIIEA